MSNKTSDKNVANEEIINNKYTHIEKVAERIVNEFREKNRGIDVGVDFSEKIDMAYKILNLLAEREQKDKQIQELEEYIAIAPNLDEMTATKYIAIQEEAYIRGKAEEQQKAEQIIRENYIPKQVIIDKIEELKNNLKYIDCNRDCSKCFNKEGKALYRGSDFDFCFAYYQIKVLQELLGGEK